MNIKEKVNKIIDAPIKQTYTLPWDRILGRGIDSLICLGVRLCCFEFILNMLEYLPRKMGVYYGDSITEELFILSGMLAYRIFVFLFYEIFFLSLFSTTPGKVLLGLRVLEHDGSRLSFRSALSRTIGVCGYLFLFFIPYMSLLIPISCLAHLYAYKTRTGKFIWDRSDRWIVTHKNGVLRINKLLIGALFLLLVFFISYFIILHLPRYNVIHQVLQLSLFLP
jgi:uncharacterized RDD family membrane protein YckC